MQKALLGRVNAGASKVGQNAAGRGSQTAVFDDRIVKKILEA